MGIMTLGEEDRHCVHFNFLLILNDIIQHGADLGLCAQSGGQKLLDSKVCQFGVELSVQQNVLWLNIAVDDLIEFQVR